MSYLCPQCSLEIWYYQSKHQMGRGALRMKYSRKEHFQEAVRVGVCEYKRDIYMLEHGDG